LSFEKFDTDITAEDRKRDHIELAFASRTPNLDGRFYYEPLFSAHPSAADDALALNFLGKQQRVPMWVSSMTGGTAFARIINQNLAKACCDFGFGMGLGSCRQLLFSDEFLPDFAVRRIVGDDLPLYANLGIAQLEQLIDTNQVYRIHDLLAKLEADGLFIHVNPMQEWLQPEGDRFKRTSAQTIEMILEKIDKPLIVKEVGQGMGYESLKYLLQLPLAGIEFAAAGGTNFAKLELLRSSPEQQAVFNAFAHVGHSANDMVEMTNALLTELGSKALVKDFIVSGGVTDFLDGYYLTEKLQANAVYGQASAFLTHARGSYDELARFITAQIEGLRMAKAVLRVRG
jgi:isopentenyl-diphosphate Delta-isomerase